jgi:hypothetical protein
MNGARDYATVTAWRQGSKQEATDDDAESLRKWVEIFIGAPTDENRGSVNSRMAAYHHTWIRGKA